MSTERSFQDEREVVSRETERDVVSRERSEEGLLKAPGGENLPQYITKRLWCSRSHTTRTSAQTPHLDHPRTPNLSLKCAGNAALESA